MRATVMYGAGDVRVEDVPDPVLREPTDALVRIVRACVCGSDLHPYHDMAASADGQPMGHEFVGVVEDTGSDVTTVRTGDFVIAPFAWSDNTCEFCREGLHTSCRHGGFWARGDVGGAQAEAIRVPLADGTLVKAAAAEDSALLPSLLTLSDVFPTGHHAAVRGRRRPGQHRDRGRRRRGRPVRGAGREAARRRADRPHGPAQGPHRPRRRVRRH